ncbi:beta-ketoacyl synthase N-terminal-like domain-containing protein [Streptomyces sp. NPDC003023]|uniref:beta-ketoacyl synthase N-terminal-like domain-containing protein n=1 Tax=Streptomyces sp. NPDC003023 TaxID=3364675 RepID=UPI003684D208
MNGAGLRAAIVERLCLWYGYEPHEIDDDRPLAELGLTSRDAVALTAMLGDRVGIRLPPTLLWETPTIGTLLTRLAHGEQQDNAPAPPVRHAPLPGNEQVAVIGVGCRFPGGADSPDGYWRLLAEGRDAVGTVPEGRWDPFVGDGSGLPGDISRYGAFLERPAAEGQAITSTGTGTDGIAGFDAEFFGIGSHEATAMDPQQRMLLEVSREALDHAALSVPSLAGTRTGVFVGISGNEYAHLTTADLASVDAWTAPGSALGVAAGRLSYLLDLRGPSLAVDTACSSSLVAVHHAVRSLTQGESDTALAAGVNLLLSPAVTLGFQRAGALAADGRCKAFDAAADGIVRGEGCGVVVLKRLSDAERDGDRVLAVITATGVGSDGRSNGLTAPSAGAQQELLTRTHLTPATVDYVEAHGTGTALGDLVEAGALGRALGSGAGRPADQPLLIGSAKTNLGHLEAAAGIAGLIKTVLALHHGEIPGQLHFSEPGPHADLEALGLRVVTGPEPWPRYSGTATAGVSAFGFGGTNAHVVLAEHRPRPAVRVNGERPVLLLLDGSSDDRVRAHAGELAEWLATPVSRSVRPADLARTLAGRTGRGRHRAAVVARSREDIATALSRYAAGAPDSRLHTGRGPAPGGPGPVWVFSGYGSQWPGMARGLLSTEPVFAAAVDRMADLLAEHAGLRLHDLLLPDAELTTPDVVMPTLFALQVALAELWRAYGTEPAAVIGHSMGEVAAAVVSGALDEATGAHVIAVRSRLLAGLTDGAMAVVDRPGDAVGAAARRFPTLRVAVHASPVQSVVTGSSEDVAGLIAQVTAEGGFARSLRVTAAGHSPAVDPLLDRFARELGTVPHADAHCRRYTTVLDDPRSNSPCDTAYWVANLRRPVRFTQAVRAAAEDGHRVFVEVSPHPTQLRPLTEALAETVTETPAEGLAGGPAETPTDRLVGGPAETPTDRQAASGAGEVLVVPTLSKDTDDALAFRSSLARLLVRGLAVTTPRELLNPGGRIADVPVPRWRHVRFWAGEEPGRATAVPSRPALAPGAGVLDRLRRCVADVMGYGEDGIDPDVPLTELGLDSLSAVRVRASVEREFGTVLEPATLLRQGTLRGVAALLTQLPPQPLPQPLPRLGDGGTGHSRTAAGARAAFGVAARLRTFPTGAGNGAPLFLAHAAGGSADVYGPLAQRLAASRPVLGFDRLPDTDEVASRAAEFAARIREVRPDGPWLLGGWSYGGLLAQEAARLLSAHGTVAALVLLDSVLPLAAPAGTTPLEEARRRFTGFASFVERTYGKPLSLPYEELAGLDDAGQVTLVLKVLEHAVELPAAVLEHQRTSYLDLRSGERHTPGAHSGRTLLYRAAESAPHTVRDTRYERTDEALGWDAYCSDLTVSPLPGHHLSLLDPPVVDTLVELLERDLPHA